MKECERETGDDIKKDQKTRQMEICRHAQCTRRKTDDYFATKLKRTRTLFFFPPNQEKRVKSTNTGRQTGLSAQFLFDSITMTLCWQKTHL